MDSGRLESALCRFLSPSEGVFFLLTACDFFYSNPFLSRLPHPKKRNFYDGN